MEKQESKIRFPPFPQPLRLRTITSYEIRILRARSEFAQGWSVDSVLELFFHCVNGKCRRSFIALYSRLQGNASLEQFKFEESVPLKPVPSNFDPEIKSLSPTFVAIFDQATAAEGSQLTDIAGPGYRKALEFLVKDYAISLYPAADAEIKKLALEKVITKFLPGDALPVVSARAAWLGNDETHYERRWVGKDLTDLKKLILAVVHFIAMRQLVVGLPVDMPDPRSN